MAQAGGGSFERAAAAPRRQDPRLSALRRQPPPQSRALPHVVRDGRRPAAASTGQAIPATRSGLRARLSPKRGDIPAADVQLLDWYENVYAVGASGTAADPILALRGRGRELWADEDADAYVRRQRKSWQ